MDVFHTSRIFYFWKIDKAKTILIVGLLAIPIFISIYLSERMPMDARYLIYLFPFFFLGISLSIKPLAGLFKGKILGKNVIIILIVIFFLIQMPFLSLYYNSYFTKYSKEDWRGIAHSIQEHSAEGDYIILVPYFTRLPFDIYYSNKSHGTYEFGVRNESEIKPILLGLKNNQAYFIVTGLINSADPDRIDSMKNIELYTLNSI